MFLEREDYMFFKCLFVKVERGSKDLKPKTNEVSSEVTGLKRCDKETLDSNNHLLTLIEPSL